MKIKIAGMEVRLEDETGDSVYMSTPQLIEMVRVLNASINQDGCFIFDILEFKV